MTWLDGAEQGEVAGVVLDPSRSRLSLDLAFVHKLLAHPGSDFDTVST